MTTPYGKKLGWQSRQIVYNLHNYYKQRKRDKTSEEYQVDCNINQLTAEATGLSVKTVNKIVAEANSLSYIDGQVLFETTEQLKKVISKSRLPMDCFIEGQIRRRVLQANLESNKPISLNGIHMLIKKEDILKSSYEYFRSLLSKLGFGHFFINAKASRVLLENPDITSHRWTYINTMKKYREEGRNIVYIDETYFSLNKNKLNNWDTDDEMNGALYYTGKGEGLIVIHAGGSDGFINGALMMIKTLNIRLCDLNYEVFNKWIKEKLLPYLPAKSLVVMDNAEYHSSINAKKPSEASTMAEIKTWLQRHNIVHDKYIGKTALLSCVNKAEIHDQIDTLLADNGHQVLRLPLYHQELNPLEFIWRDLRLGNFLENSAIYNLEDMSMALEVIFENYPLEKWESCIEYIANIEEEYCHYNRVFEKIIGIPVPLLSYDMEDGDDE